MALRSRLGYRTRVPGVSSKRAQTKQLSFKDAVDTYTDNDDLKPTALRAAIDARFVNLGRYKTRKGLDRYTVPVGEDVDTEQKSTTGADTFTVDGKHSIAQMVTVVTGGAATKVEINVRSTDSSRGSLIVELYTDISGLPGTLIAQSSIAPSIIGTSFAYVPVHFVQAPLLVEDQTVWLVVRGQDENTGAYELSTTTNASDALTRDFGGTWVSGSPDINYKLLAAPEQPIKGIYRAFRSNGLRVTLFAAGDSMYKVDDITGEATAIKTGMDAAATRYRFAMAQDAVYWVNEFEKPYKYDLATDTVTQVTTAPYSAYLIVEHKGLIFYGDPADRNKTYFTNFGEYDKFKSTDFLTVMAPKSPDSHTAYAKLNGVLYIFARRNKFVVYGDSNATWSLDEAPSQRGTFSQESVAYDADTIFHADADGIWAFNGTEDVELSEFFREDYKAIPNKENICLELYNNRLYVFYTPPGAPQNNQCFVINLSIRKLESEDTNTYVGRTFARLAQDDQFIQGSNRVAALYYAEQESNQYDNLGAPLNFELRTGYSHFETPGQLKRIPKWRPRFGSVIGQYGVDCGYAKDDETEAVWTTVDLSADNPRFDQGHKFDSGVRFASDRTVSPTSLLIAGDFTRIQRRYRHIAAHEPVEFDSEILTIEAQRLI
ncbi:hypothetical protein GS464_20240 [Rhodococcus hoagii]|nr:hypothetical protein [Prescottella equi]MBM4644792.1 hypothetical protein [Prescottella equi]